MWSPLMCQETVDKQTQTKKIMEWGPAEWGPVEWGPVERGPVEWVHWGELFILHLL